MKTLTIGTIVLGVLIGFLLTYDVRLSPLGVSPRIRPFGVAQTQLLVDSDPSPLSDIDIFTEADGNLAFNFAEYANSPLIRAAAAKAVNEPESAVSVNLQVNQDVSRAAANAQEAQAGDTILGDARRFAIFLRVDAGSFVMQIFTQAPTGLEAIHMGNAVAKAMQSLNHRFVASGHVRTGRVVLRQIFPAYGGAVDKDIAAEAFAALSLIVVLLLLAGLLIVTRNRFRRTDLAGEWMLNT